MDKIECPSCTFNGVAINGEAYCYRCGFEWNVVAKKAANVEHKKGGCQAQDGTKSASVTVQKQ